MLFNSFEFLWFFLIVYAVYSVVRHRAQNILLLVTSYFFYAQWDARFLALIAFSTILDYVCGLVIGRSESSRTRRVALVSSLAGNLGVLGFFKYFDFFIESLDTSLALWSIDAAALRLEIVLPVGISFYTFQTMSYTIDVYRRRIPPTANLLDLAVYVAFFPQLVAGPIERAARFLPQVQSRRTIGYEGVREGGWLVLVGLFKKVVIADNLAPIANRVFADPSAVSGLEVLIGIYAFAFQIYGDFSGYSDIARGLSKLMGFDLVVNFRMPYLAVDPRDFWRRWHISLSAWLRDYLYIPLGGNRRGHSRTVVNLMITMLLGGLWHGAAWHFVAWGLYHGILLVVHRELGPVLERTRPHGRLASRAWYAAQLFVTFHAVCLGWILFRVDNVLDVPVVLDSLLSASSWFGGWNLSVTVQAAWLALLVVPLLIFQAFEEKTSNALVVKSWPLGVRFAVYMILVAGISALAPTYAQEFVYFQF